MINRPRKVRFDLTTTIVNHERYGPYVILVHRLLRAPPRLPLVKRKSMEKGGRKAQRGETSEKENRAG
jgi:hypothetical protein